MNWYIPTFATMCPEKDLSLKLVNTLESQFWCNWLFVNFRLITDWKQHRIQGRDGLLTTNHRCYIDTVLSDGAESRPTPFSWCVIYLTVRN